ncbi:MAG: acyltransferase 3 [Herbinix sp.]|nr:acyltransferase 3 [Herbinix sp.]
MIKIIKQMYYTETNNSCGNSRNYFIDNLKFLLMILVVVGHFGLKLTYIDDIKYLLYFIYVFHMPCFIFVSGFLAKRMNAGGKLRADKILSIFWMYLIFKFGNVLIGYACQEKVSLSLFKDASAPWYLIALCIWYLSIPLLERIKTHYLITGSFLVGLMAGYVSSFKDIFSLSRVFVFFPFFIIGFCLPEKKLEKVLGKRLRLPAVLLLTALLGSFLIFGRSFTSVARIIYGTSPYSSSLGDLAPYGFFIRGLWYVLACAMSLAFILLVPRCKLFFSKYGERTLQIYMTHIWCRNILIYIGFFSMIKSGPKYLSVLILLGSVALTFLLSNTLLKKLFDLFMASGLFRKIVKNN